MQAQEIPWLNELNEGDEFSWIYSTESEFRQMIVAFIDRGLQNCDKVLMWGTPGELQKLSGKLSEWHNPIGNALEDGRVELITLPKDAKTGTLQKIDHFIDLLDERITVARDQGFSRVRMTGDVGVLLPGKGSRENALLKLEMRLKKFTHQHRCTGLWQYNAHKFGYSILLILLTTRPRVGVGAHLYKSPSYINPEEFEGFRNTALPAYHWVKSAVIRSEVEEILGSGDRWFRSIFDKVFQFIGVVDPDGTLIEINQTALDYGKLKRRDVLGQPIWEGAWFKHSNQTGGKIRDAISRAGRNEFVRDEVEIIADEDRRLVFDFSFQPVLNENGVAALVIVEGRDITESKLFEKRLSERNALLEATLNGAPVILTMVDLSGIIRIFSGEGMYNLIPPQENFIGKSVYEAYNTHPDIIENFERAIGGESFSKDIDHDGMIFTVQYTPFRDESGNIAGAIGVATNKTQIKTAIHELDKSEARFRTIYERAGIGIALKDLDGHVVDSNPAFQRMLGYSSDELRNKTFIDLTYPGDLMTVLPLYNALFDGRLDHIKMEKRYLGKNGRIVWGQVVASLVRTSDGKPRVAVIMVEDITERKSMAVELEEVRRLLMESRDSERLQIAQELHDGPLQDLYAISYQLRSIDQTDSREKISALLSNVDGMLKSQIQTLRALCGELRPPTLAPFGLEKAIQSHAEKYQQMHPEVKMVLDLMHDGKTLPEKVRLTLFRIYQELINNVTRHSRATQVIVRFHLDDEQSLLEVEDNGRGFTIPERWVDLARHGHLGLVGILERVEAIGGYMKVRSQPGMGTIAQVSIPRVLREPVWEYNKMPSVSVE